MAASSSVHTNTYGGRTITLKVEEIGTNVENNTSTVKWTLTSGTSSTYHNVYEITAWVGGTDTAHRVYGPKTATWESRAFPCKDGSTSGTLTIAHNQDGTADPLTFRLRGSVFTNNPQNYDGSITLTVIPRASSITVNDANIGSATNIVINKANANFTTTLYYKASGQNSWTKIVDKTANQTYGWIVPTSFYSLIPNSRTIQCEIKAETYNESTLIGEKTTTATFTATGNPVINSFTLIDTNSTTIALTGDSSKMVRYVSNVKATVSSSTAHNDGSSISSNKVNGSSTSSGEVTFNGTSTNSYQLVVTDSRGYTTSQTKTMTMIDYVPLTINANISRNTPVDGKINISFNGNYFNSSFGSQSNTLTIQYRSIEKGGSWENVQWNNLTATLNNNAYSGTGQLSNYDYTKQYEFQIRAVDKVQTKTIEGISVSKGQPIFNWRDGYFNINGNIYQNEVLLSTIYLEKNSLLNKTYPVGSIYMSVNSTNPATLFGGTWTQLKDRFLLGAGDTYTNGATGGEASHILTTNELPDMGSFLSLNWNDQNNYNTGIFGDGGMKTTDRTASIGNNFGEHWTTLKGGEQAHNNMPPYLVVYMWKRTA